MYRKSYRKHSTDLARLLSAEVAVVVGEVLLDPLGQFGALVSPGEALVSKQQHSVVGLAPQRATHALRSVPHRVER